jgi:transcriptional regulator with XRE-family HTH domain
MKEKSHLRTNRKKTAITQSDIVFLLQQNGNSYLSRCEKGTRIPSLEIIIAYHLLFNVPALTYFNAYLEEVKQHMVARIPPLIAELREQEPKMNVLSRIDHLHHTLIKLTFNNSNEDSE